MVGFAACGWKLEELVRGFGDEGAVLDESAIANSVWPADPELDERKRDPLVALLDDAGLAENDFVRDDVMREAASFTCHKTPPIYGFGLCRFGR